MGIYEIVNTPSNRGAVGAFSCFTADDYVLNRSISSVTDAINRQADQNGLLKGEADWLMQFHPSKCQVLRVTNKRKPTKNRYTKHSHTLEEVDTAKYLGLTFHKNLSWNTHIEES